MQKNLHDIVCELFPEDLALLTKAACLVRVHITHKGKLTFLLNVRPFCVRPFLLEDLAVRGMSRVGREHQEKGAQSV